MALGELYIPLRRWKDGTFMPNWLLRRPEITFGAKCTFVRLTQYAGSDGVAYPKQETLANELGVSERQLRDYLWELERAGLIQSTRMGCGRPCEVRFIEHSWELDTAPIDRSKRPKRTRTDRNNGSSQEEDGSAIPHFREMGNDRNNTSDQSQSDRNECSAVTGTSVPPEQEHSFRRDWNNGSAPIDDEGYQLSSISESVSCESVSGGESAALAAHSPEPGTTPPACAKTPARATPPDGDLRLFETDQQRRTVRWVLACLGRDLATATSAELLALRDLFDGKVTPKFVEACADDPAVTAVPEGHLLTVFAKEVALRWQRRPWWQKPPFPDFTPEQLTDSGYVFALLGNAPETDALAYNQAVRQLSQSKVPVAFFLAVGDYIREQHPGRLLDATRLAKTAVDYWQQWPEALEPATPQPRPRTTDLEKSNRNGRPEPRKEAATNKPLDQYAQLAQDLGWDDEHYGPGAGALG